MVSIQNGSLGPEVPAPRGDEHVDPSPATRLENPKMRVATRSIGGGANIGEALPFCSTSNSNARLYTKSAKANR